MKKISLKTIIKEMQKIYDTTYELRENDQDIYVDIVVNRRDCTMWPEIYHKNEKKTQCTDRNIIKYNICEHGIVKPKPQYYATKLRPELRRLGWIVVCEECETICELTNDDKLLIELFDDLKLPQLVGTRRQIDWAEDIRKKMFHELEILTFDNGVENTSHSLKSVFWGHLGWDTGRIRAFLNFFEEKGFECFYREIFDYMVQQTHSSWWILNRDGLFDCTVCAIGSIYEKTLGGEKLELCWGEKKYWW